MRMRRSKRNEKNCYYGLICPWGDRCRKCPYFMEKPKVPGWLVEAIRRKLIEERNKM